MATANIDALYGKTLVSQDGSKIGKVEGVFLDHATGEPEWVSVKTGMFGGHETLVPLAATTTTGDDLSVPFDKDKVKDAPHYDPGQELSTKEEAELFEYYGISYGGETVTAQGGAGTGQTYTDTDRVDDRTDRTDTVGHDTSGPNTDNAMTRSEERLQVGKQSVESGRARLRKYIVTENVTQTVPVSREEVRVEREPITDANIGDATSGRELSEEEHEVVLHEERPMVTKETVPVERVRLDTETVTENVQVSEEVRKEQIEMEGVEGREGRDTTVDNDRR